MWVVTAGLHRTSKLYHRRAQKAQRAGQKAGVPVPHLGEPEVGRQWQPTAFPVGAGPLGCVPYVLLVTVPGPWKVQSLARGSWVCPTHMTAALQRSAQCVLSKSKGGRQRLVVRKLGKHGVKHS